MIFFKNLLFYDNINPIITSGWQKIKYKYKIGKTKGILTLKNHVNEENKC